MSGNAGSGMGSTGSGLFSTIYGITQMSKGNKQRKKAERQSEQELNARPTYEVSDYAKANLANAQAALYAKDPASLMLYNQAQQAAANTAAAAQRNASSGAEAIQATAMAQTMAQNMMPQISDQQRQYSMQQQMNNARALQGMTDEYQNVFNDKLDTRLMRLNFRLGQLGAANQKVADGATNTTQGLHGMGSSAAEFFGGKMGKSGGMGGK